MQGKFTKDSLEELKLKIIAITHIAMSYSDEDELADVFRKAGASLCAGIDIITSQLDDDETIDYILVKGD